MRSQEEQMHGLAKLGAEIGRAEVNFVINKGEGEYGDTASLEMLDTPYSPQMVYADERSDGYDFWSWKTGRLELVETNIPLEQAASFMINEYFTAKAHRVKKLHPDLSFDDIMEKLREGYQK
jgi:hypothetical protein